MTHLEALLHMIATTSDRGRDLERQANELMKDKRHYMQRALDEGATRQQIANAGDTTLEMVDTITK